jgi:hypothetical protein
MVWKLWTKKGTLCVECVHVEHLDSGLDSFDRCKAYPLNIRDYVNGNDHMIYYPCWAKNGGHCRKFQQKEEGKG